MGWVMPINLGWPMGHKFPPKINKSISTGPRIQTLRMGYPQKNESCLDYPKQVTIKGKILVKTPKQETKYNHLKIELMKLKI
ncbi:hypothetical protein CSR02_01105 [Acetobacter pomorum]|uniref:Uncharacterized protein n=1 Tax=Acetobacter pomorum TaxID=65959 RepID=A0A2G4RFS5_9PROT|nr:hypothetical protein CSR02_01105 [Acetobacter pomorum]